MMEKGCLSKLTEMLADHRADHKTTSSTSFCHMRPTLNDTYRDGVKHTNHKEQLNCNEYKNALKIIYGHTVNTQLNKASKHLCTPQPKIAEEEQTLPRIARIRLARLRTEYCPL